MQGKISELNSISGYVLSLLLISHRIFDNSRYISYLQQSNIHLTDDPIIKISSHWIFTKSGQESIPANSDASYVDLVMKVIAPVLQDRASFVEVKPDSENEYNENLHEKIAMTIFNNSCGSVRKYIPFSYAEDIYI